MRREYVSTIERVRREFVSTIEREREESTLVRLRERYVYIESESKSGKRVSE